MKVFMLLTGWLVGLAWFALVVIFNKLDFRLKLKFINLFLTFQEVKIQQMMSF